jgi:uncharacterized protein (TIGR03435 family)
VAKASRPANRTCRPDPGEDAASPFTVLPEQLGLTLEAAHVAMPVMVVDRAERPSQD